jgi:uncharacterized protein YjbI with pentapeptide repeats
LETLAAGSGLQIVDRVVEGARFQEGTFRFLSVERTRLIDCDLSNCVWERARLENVEFRGCRLTGFALVESKGDDVRFEGCRGQYVRIVKADMKSAAFVDCKLPDATFAEARLLRARFEGCELQRSVWSDCNLHGADLRGCDTGGMRAQTRDLAGAVLDPAQATALLAALDIRVLEEGEPID